MGLTSEQIKLLLAKPEKRGGRSASGKQIDTSVRDYATWFKLAHKLFDDDKQEFAKCANPQCLDERPEEMGKVVAMVNGQFMCRLCFLDGWLEVDPKQASLLDPNAS